MAHDMSDYIDSIKESLTDAQYKEGMELCQKVFQQSERKLYRMTYLRPYTFMNEHCEEEDCDDMKLYISFTKATALVQLTSERVAKIQEQGMFCGKFEEMKDFIEMDVLHSFPLETDELEMDIGWFEFPVLSLDPL